MIELDSPLYKKITLGLGISSFLIFCNLYYFQPLLPYFMGQFNASEIEVNWLFSSSTLGVALSLIPWAIISEVYGRRPVMLTSLLLIPFVNLLMFFSQELSHLIVLRALLGISLAGFIAVAVAYMAEELEPHALLVALGTYISANSLGGISGRIYGGVMTDFVGLKWTILSMSILSILAILLVFPLIIKQRNFVPQNARFFHHNRQLVNHIREPKIFLATIIGGLNFAILISTYTIMGFKLSAEPISLPASITSLIFLCYLGGTLSSQLSGRWNKHYSSLLGIFVGTVVCFIALLVLFIESMFAIFIGLFLLSSGAFFIHSLAYGYVGKNVKQGKSTATALYLVMYYTGSSLGGFVFIYCWQVGAWSMVFTVATITYLVMSIINFSLVKQSQVTMRACVN